MSDIVNRLKERFSDKLSNIEVKSPRRVYIDFKPQDVTFLAKFMFTDMGCRLVTATGIDTPEAIEILYHFSCDRTGEMISLRTFINDKARPNIESIAPMIKGAEWIEREIWELLGVNFANHPDLRHLLLIDEWPEGEYPLRHDRKNKPPHDRDHDHDHDHEHDHEKAGD